MYEFRTSFFFALSITFDVRCVCCKPTTARDSTIQRKRATKIISCNEFKDSFSRILIFTMPVNFEFISFQNEVACEKVFLIRYYKCQGNAFFLFLTFFNCENNLNTDPHRSIDILENCDSILLFV